MSTMTVTDLAVPIPGGKYHFLLRRLHSLSGITFGGYVTLHLTINASVVEGSVYQTQVNTIHSLPFLPLVEWGLLFLPLIYHAIYGTWIALTGQPNVINYAYGRNWLYLLQRISAAILFFFILFHVMALKHGLFGTGLSFTWQEALASLGRHMHQFGFVTYVVYPLGILAACFHFANGMWAAGITWGLTVGARAQRRWGIVCLVLFLASLTAGTTALIAGMNIAPAVARALPTVTP